ncbi:MAG: RNA 3'-terminal phosphate cyclase [Candidatus Methanomethyliaceae archaeon]|nr:RNA 3'-terminal phosphate cyclase [Candidatus Methanomethyliaceae archaeon]
MEIDGSHGEGGGQVLRGAVALSCLTGKAIKVFDIRGKRPKPGLQPQHLISLQAAASVSEAEVKGLDVGSTTITFSPKTIKGGRYTFDIKTAGSVTLVIQTLLPILSFAGEPAEVKIIGGTDVPWSPPIDYVRYVALPALRTFGLDAALDLNRRGHYPKGGGGVELRVGPVRTLSPFRALERGPVEAIRGVSNCTNLPVHVAARQASSATKILKEKGYTNVRIAEEQTAGQGPGSDIVLWAEVGGGIRIGADALGAREKSAEDVGREATEKLLRELQTEMAIDRHLVDMIILYMALANGTSEAGVSALTLHSETMMWLSKVFLNVEWQVRKMEGGAAIIKVDGVGLKNVRIQV